MGSGEEESESTSTGPCLWAGSRDIGGARNLRPLNVHSEHRPNSQCVYAEAAEFTNWGLALA